MWLKTLRFFRLECPAGVGCTESGDDAHSYEGLAQFKVLGCRV